MAHILVRHKVRDYTAYKPRSDDHATSCSKGGFVFRNADDSNQILVLLRWDDLEKAQEFTQSDELREKMQEAGVVDRTNVHFLDKDDKPSE